MKKYLVTVYVTLTLTVKYHFQDIPNLSISFCSVWETLYADPHTIFF